MNKWVLVFFFSFVLSTAKSTPLSSECSTTTALNETQLNQLTAALSGRHETTYQNESAAIFNHLDSFYERTGKPVTEAKVIFLGAPHTMPSLNLGNQVIINKLANPGDIVLVEGFNAGEILPRATQKKDTRTEVLKSGLTVLGWDSLPALDASLVNDQESRKNPELDVVEAERDAAARKDPNSPDTKRLRILADKQHGLLINHVKLELIQRNLALIETIKRARAKNPQAKIFILAGDKHFTSAVSTELKSYLNSLPTTALIPNYLEWDKFQTGPEEKAATRTYQKTLDHYQPGQLLHLAHPCGNLLYNEQIPFLHNLQPGSATR